MERLDIVETIRQQLEDAELLKRRNGGPAEIRTRDLFHSTCLKKVFSWFRSPNKMKDRGRPRAGIQINRINKCSNSMISCKSLVIERMREQSILLELD